MIGLVYVVHAASHFLYLAQNVTSTACLPFLAYLLQSNSGRWRVSREQMDEREDSTITDG